MSLSMENFKVWLEESGHDSAVLAAAIPTLESGVIQQLQGELPYCFDANKCLIKLYQFHPQQQQEPNNDSNLTMARILFLSLLEFPSTDILALSCIIPQRIQDTEPCATILRCAELLDSGHLVEFWNLYLELEKSSTFTDLMMTMTASDTTKHSFQERLRHAIATHFLGLSYRMAPLQVVQDALNVTDQTIENYVERVDVVETKNGSTISTVLFPATAHNTKRNRIFQKGVSLEEISTLLHKNSLNAKTMTTAAGVGVIPKE